jgi:CysZ protein
VPLVGVAAFFAANAYLLSREYFEMAAARYRPLPEAGEMRRHFSLTTLAAGCLLAGLMVIPVANLLTPLFGIALMVHVHKGLSRKASLAPPGQPRRLP